MADTLIKFMGLADILVASILSFYPSLIYDSFPTRALASATGLHLSDAGTAPGFNQAIACMVAAVGVGHVVASRCGPAARPPIFAMNLVWAILGLITCATPHAWGLGNATMLMSSLNHTVLTSALYLMDPSLGSSSRKTKAL